MIPCIYCGLSTFLKCENCQEAVCCDECSMSHARICFKKSIPLTCALCGYMCTGARLGCMHSMHPACAALASLIGGCTACYALSSIGDSDARFALVAYLRDYARDGPSPMPDHVIQGLERSNDKNSLWRLTLIYGGFGMEANREKELEFIQKAANQGDARAFMKLADLYPEKRVEYLTLAADGKHPDACFEMNELLAPAPKAHAYLISAALGGHCLALFKLGLVYRQKKRPHLALRKFLEAMHQNFKPAIDQIIQVFMDDLKDFPTAYHWAMRADFTPSILFTTGRLYFEMKQYEKARNAFRESDSRDAKYYLAMMLLRGEGGDVDTVESNRLVHAAAAEEQAGACLYLAVHYYFKIGDLEKGRFYLKIAEDREVPESTLVSAQIKMEEGDRKGAAPLITKAITLGLSHAHYLAALNAIEDNDVDLAKKHLQTMLEEDDDEQARKVLESL